MSAGAGRGGTELPVSTPSVFEMTLRLSFPGLYAIIQERMRQVKGEGFDEFHDDQHVNGELVQAAAYYAYHEKPGWEQSYGPQAEDLFPALWDRSWAKRRSYPAPTDEDLAKAGALIAAELDRRKRARRGWHPQMDRR